VKNKDIPAKLRPFVALGYEYQPDKVSGDNSFADCPFCSGRNKLYIDTETGLWDCKAGACGRRGNIFTYMNLWHTEQLTDQDVISDRKAWTDLSEDRILPVDVLKAAGIIYNGIFWYIPIRNPAGSIVNFRRYKIGAPLLNMPELEPGLYGSEILADDDNKKKDVYICEGEWDAIAMRHFLERDGIEAVVVGAPGAAMWKDNWTELFVGHDSYICYDNDTAGLKGAKRVWDKVSPRAQKMYNLIWPQGLPEGFDIRDFYTKGAGLWEDLQKLFQPYLSEETKDSTPSHKENAEKYVPIENFDDRPLFKDVVEVFKSHLHMTKDMEMALRIILGVVISKQISGDPLWMQIVSPPGTAKTELLMPLSDCPSCHFASTLTAHSLISGFVTQGGNDPSLLPKLDGKTFVLKDFTEILNMPKMMKDEVYGTLRGAYDGSVQKQFGNGIVRDYTISFNMLCGVTHAVFGERSASLGERFLIFHLVKGVDFESDDAIISAISNVGKEKVFRHDLNRIVRDFVEVIVPKELIPEMSPEILRRIVALASLVAMLRASVDKAYTGAGQERLMYRPQHEMGTRLGKQLAKLAYGLSMVNSPPSLGESEYRIVSRVALDTCVGLNLEAVAYIVKNPGKKIEEICDAIEIPMSTLRDQLDDMAMLNVIRKEKKENPHGRGAPMYLYHVTEKLERYWNAAGLGEDPEVEALPEKRDAVRKIKRVRRRQNTVKEG
jgi:hypothetical protein